MKPEEINIASIAAQFSDEAAAWGFMEELRWPDGPVCPHCGSIDSAHLIKSNERKTRKGHRTYRREWTCQGCKQQFSVLVGTIFESSHVPLAKWLLALHMMCSNKNGVAALEIKRTLHVAYKTAWFMCHRIREAMADGPLADALRLKGIVEVDVLYFAEAGDGHLHLVRPVNDGDLLAIGNEADELETVEVLKAFPPGYVAQLTEPLKHQWPDGTPVGTVVLR